MPELPEVEALRLTLVPVVTGARIARLVLRREGLRRPFPAHLARSAAGATVERLSRRGKYLLAELSTGATLVLHLGMSGWLRVERGTHARQPHDHAVFELASGDSIVLNDPRRFGVLDLVSTAEISRQPALAALGPEPLSNDFTPEWLVRACARSRRSIKVALLDQRVVAGLGNIYASEALHLARLSPRRRASTLATSRGRPTAAAHRVAAAIEAVLTRAVDQLQHEAGEQRFRVYDRESARCPRRGCRGRIRRIVQAGRSTFFCPVCQR